MDEAELSQIVAEQLRRLGEQIRRAGNLPTPLKSLVEGEVHVTLKMHKGHLRVLWCAELDALRIGNKMYAEAVANASKELKESNKEVARLVEDLKRSTVEIKRLVAELKEQETPEKPDTEQAEIEAITKELTESVESQKKKRKRKTKK